MLSGSDGAPAAQLACVRRPHLSACCLLRAGHRNLQTVKGVSFLGLDDEFVASGSDCGHLFVWSKRDGRLRRMLHGDSHVLNCVEPHPHQPLTVATSGIDDDIKVWAAEAAPLADGAEAAMEDDVPALEGIVRSNRHRQSCMPLGRNTFLPFLLHFRCVAGAAPCLACQWGHTWRHGRCMHTAIPEDVCKRHALLLVRLLMRVGVVQATSAARVRRLHGIRAAGYNRVCVVGGSRDTKAGAWSRCPHEGRGVPAQGLRQHKACCGILSPCCDSRRSVVLQQIV